MKVQKNNYIKIWILCSVLFVASFYVSNPGDEFVFVAGTFPLLQLGFLWGFMAKYKPRNRWVYRLIFALLVLCIIAELLLLWYFLALAKAYREYPH